MGSVVVELLVEIHIRLELIKHQRRADNAPAPITLSSPRSQRCGPAWEASGKHCVVRGFEARRVDEAGVMAQERARGSMNRRLTNLVGASKRGHAQERGHAQKACEVSL